MYLCSCGNQKGRLDKICATCRKKPEIAARHGLLPYDRNGHVIIPDYKHMELIKRWRRNVEEQC